MYSSILLPLALAACTNAAPTSTYGPGSGSPAAGLAPYMKGFKDPVVSSSAEGHAICISGTIDVQASTKNIPINLKPPFSRIDIVELGVENTQANSTHHKDLFGKPTTVEGTFGVYSQLCFPTNGDLHNTTVQFLTHGLGCDRAYWDVAPGYSLVDHAALQGQTTFLYDRLGNGRTEHPDPVNVAQGTMEVALAHSLVQLLRAGGVAGHAFKNVVGVGHSYGSFITLALTSLHPTDLNATVLTGFTENMAGQVPGFAAFDLIPAAEAEPLRFGNLSTGYLTGSAIAGVQFAFFRAPGFDPALLNIAENTKQTISLGEFLLGNEPLNLVAGNYTGPVDILVGDHDLLNCDGDCLYPKNWAATARDYYYPKSDAEGSDWFIQKNAGHFWNYHYTAKSGFDHIQQFFRKNGF